MNLRSLDDVKACIERDRKRGLDARMARLMLKHGNLTSEARAWLASEFPQEGGAA